ncbi:hypothetical protein P7C70_g5088, partial [Phenoliferia sp. Uapishka_3]
MEPSLPIAKHFHIFGFPVSSSKSPILHGAGFKHHNLPHTYDIRNCEKLDESTIALIRDPAFGGASVTMPHKSIIHKYLDSSTPLATLLGAVNTIVPKKDAASGKIELVGDNTDWVGILRLLKQELKPEHEFDITCSGLVIGAGGAGRAAVYALHELGLSTIYLYNRTASTARAVKAAFPSSYNIVIIPSLAAENFKSGAPICIVGTVPASATSIDETPSPPGLYLDRDCVSRKQGGVLIDMAYLPRRTPLVRLAENKQEWVVQTGIMVLLTQGYAQFEMWNGLKAPEKEIREAVLAAYDAENPIEKV